MIEKSVPKMLCCCETSVNPCIYFKLIISFRIWLQLEGSMLLSVLGFPFALNMEAGNLVKDAGFLRLLIIQCIFHEVALVDKANIPCCMRIMRKTWDLNSL